MYEPVPGDTEIKVGSSSGGGGGGTTRWTPPPPPPSNPPACGTWDFGCKAANFWHEHKAVIVSVTVAVVVTVGCEVATGGAGSIGCAAAGGAAGNLAGYAVSTPPDQWSTGGAFGAAAVGAVAGAAGGVLGKAAGWALGKLATTAAGKAVSGAVGEAAGKARAALGKLGGAGGEASEDVAADGAAAGRGAASKSAESPRASVEDAGGCNSFVAGTPVKLADGTSKPIEDVKAGDKVLATDPVTGKTAAKAVVAAFSGVGYVSLVQVTVDTDGRRGHKTGVILATEHHLFWDAADRTWVRADKLTGADRLRLPDGRTLRVVSAVAVQGHPAVHDLTVADYHTYYVLASTISVLVHNCGDVYRSDTRDPNVIFNEGFAAKGNNMNLEEHVAGVSGTYTPDSGFVSTTTSKSHALSRNEGDLRKRARKRGGDSRSRRHRVVSHTRVSIHVVRTV